MARKSVSMALTGSGGAGVMTAGQAILDAAAKAGYFGLMGRSLGPQIRGGESAALLRLAVDPVQVHDDHYDVLVACDWGNIERFSGELPLSKQSLIFCDPSEGDVPAVMAKHGSHVIEVPFKDLSKEVPGGRVNSVVMGVVAQLIGLPVESLREILGKALKKKGPEALEATMKAVELGMNVAETVDVDLTLEPAEAEGTERWSMTGNEAAGLGALRGGVRFVAAYPITPSTDVLEWMAPNLPKVGGTLVQCEDELCSINMAIGGSFAGKASMTATSGPGLALMAESLGLGVASETPVFVVNVMRGGPSTGIPTKSEQSDLNIAIHGLHGDAPHVVVAPNGIDDCLFTSQWGVYLAEAMQTPVIMLSDQAIGQAKAVVPKPADIAFVGKRVMPEGQIAEGYNRYAVTNSGVSPMAIPGMKGGEYVADGLEHAPSGRPSTRGEDHQEQLDKRLRKLTTFDYGDHWADVEGEGDVAVICFGSVTGAVREGIHRAADAGVKAKLISMRLLAPALPEKLSEAIGDAKKILVVEQNHSRQLCNYLKGEFDLPVKPVSYCRPGPLAIRPQEIADQVKALG